MTVPPDGQARPSRTGAAPQRPSGHGSRAVTALLPLLGRLPVLGSQPCQWPPAAACPAAGLVHPSMAAQRSRPSGRQPYR